MNGWEVPKTATVECICKKLLQRKNTMHEILF